MSYRILMSNLGYARGIDGRLSQHVRYAHRHVYCRPAVQSRALDQFRAILEEEDPDLCCLIEIDQDARGFSQLDALARDRYPVYDIASKYGEKSPLRRFALTRGKSNAFLSREPLEFARLSFETGTKRLVYRLRPDGFAVYFAHFSLKRPVRAQQLLQARRMLEEERGGALFLGDFNILSGLGELAPLLHGGAFVLTNPEDRPTFQFHRRSLVLDLCIASKDLAPRVAVKVIPQPFSDHAALVIDVENPA